MRPFFQVNAFASELFRGNPALVVPLDGWLDDAVMQAIAAENGLTAAFFVGGSGRYDIRWFAPKAEIKGLCGHGTLAAGYVVAEELGDSSDEIVFHAEAGEVRVRRQDGQYVLDLPALVPEPITLPESNVDAFGTRPTEVLGALDLIAVLPSARDVTDFVPNHEKLADLPLRAVIVTAPDEDADFVSRWFAFKHGEGEDTGFTGSAHCSLVPYWAERLNKTELKARQPSPRGATLPCALHGDRVWLTSSAVKYMQGSLCL